MRVDDLGVQRRAPVGDAVHGVDEDRDVADALLEQVADALGVVADQVDGVGLLEVLREHEHAGLGERVAQLDRRAQAVVLVGRRHLDVDDGDVGAMRARAAQEVVGVAGLRDDLEAGALEDARDPLAQQDVVLADHDPNRHDANPTRSARP